MKELLDSFHFNTNAFECSAQHKRVSHFPNSNLTMVREDEEIWF